MFADPSASALDIVAFIGQNLADGVGCVFLGVNSSKGDMCEGAWKVYAGALIFGPPVPPPAQASTEGLERSAVRSLRGRRTCYGYIATLCVNHGASSPGVHKRHAHTVC
jgi:hypothetical protein